MVLAHESRSQVMADKVFSAPRERVQKQLGELSALELQRVDEALRLWLAL